jgi:ATP-dependent DNA helicase PIF1
MVQLRAGFVILYFMTQKEALDILKLGHNVYLTGSAGSGKTYILNQFIDYLKKHHVEVGITASTGIAATHLGGVTIHSWSGLGIRDTLTDYDLDMLEQRAYLWKRIQNTKVLIIDEVSMLHHFRLDMVDKLLRSFRRSDKPFGGIQVVLCGDFFQLPPVARAGEPEAHFSYKAEVWTEMDLKICYLHEQHRQKDDACLAVLNAIRSNDVSEEVLEHLRSRYKKPPRGKIAPTRLYTHNVDVDSINAKELAATEGEERIFEMATRGRTPLVEALKKSCLAPERLVLKTGARVMFVKNNFEAGYVNGTLGVIEGFDDNGPVVRTSKGENIVASPMTWTIEEEGKVKAELTQVPLRLAWAITVHKSQGMSLDAVEVDLSKSFEKGMGYVALSRVRTLDGLTLHGLNDVALQIHEEVLELDIELKQSSMIAEEELGAVDEKEKVRLQKEYIERIAPKDKEKKKKQPTEEITMALVRAGHTLNEIAKARDLKLETIVHHLEACIREGKIDPELSLGHVRPENGRFEKIRAAFARVLKETGEFKLTPVKEILGGSFSFDEIKIARLFIKKSEL